MLDYEVEFRGINLGQSPYCITGFEGLGSPELRSQELEIPNEDGISFGREYHGARKWVITGSVKGGDPDKPATGTDVDAAWNAMSALTALWDSPDARTEERDLTYITFQRPGRNAVLIYGRPERIDPDVTMSYNGYIGYSAIFRQSDPRFYATSETVAGSAITVPYSGGLLYNGTEDGILLPFTTTAVTEHVGGVFSAGDTNTWPVITINGPVLNPRCAMQVDSSNLWEIQLKTSLLSGQSIVIDTRPWARSVTRSDGANVAGTIRGNKLSDIVVPPGWSDFVYDGQDGTATTTAELRFRDAWAAL